MATETEPRDGRSKSSPTLPMSDPRLERLLELWDRLDEDSGVPNSLGVTLLVDGAIYSGLLIAGRIWAKTMSELLRSTAENAQISALSVFFDEIQASYEGADGSAEMRQYLHLANAAVGTPGEGRTTGLLLRIRVADVSGWTVGTAGPLPPFNPSLTTQQPPSGGL